MPLKSSICHQTLCLEAPICRAKPPRCGTRRHIHFGWCSVPCKVKAEIGHRTASALPRWDCIDAQGVKRPKAESGEGKTPALGNHRALEWLAASDKGSRQEQARPRHPVDSA